MINARTEVVAKAKLERQVRSQNHPDDGCTGAVILPERSATGQIIHGQNWDWRAECVHTAIVLRVQRDDGPDFLTFVEAGGLARSGLNAAGISITANYLESDLDHQQVGVPLVCIRRKVLEQQHLAAALRVVAATPKSCSNNMMIGSAEGFAIDFECAPNEAFLIYPEDGMIVHANHFMSPVALSKLKDIGIKRFPDTLYRDWRVKERLKSGRRLTIADLKAALADNFAQPFSVCRPPEPTPEGDLLATVATVILNPVEGYMEVAPLPAEGVNFTRYSLRTAEQAVAAE
jgi:isopenicillin-N N-acyltransferase-like protein